MESENSGLAAFFVYGTLKPGGLYWPRIASLVAYYEQARVKGRLYDTGLGYPAARFGDEFMIEGVMLFVVEPNVAGVTTIMDEIEGEGREYHRVEIVTEDGQRASAYEWALPVDGLAPIDGPF